MKKLIITLLSLAALSFAQDYNPLLRRKLDINSIGTKGAFGTPLDGYGIIWNAVNARPEWGILPGSAGGEANTGTNLGAGIGVFKNKVGVDFKFKSLQSANNRITVTANADGDHVDLTIVEANFVLTTSQITGLDATLAGAINSGSSVGTGVAVLKDEASNALRFKTLQSASNRLTVAANADGNHVDLTIVEANFVLATSQITGLDAALAAKAPLADGVANILFASLPSAATVSGRKYLVTDAPSKTECGADGGDGTTPALCYSNGITYIALSSTGGSGTPGGSSGQIQVNEAGSFGGRTLLGFTNDGVNLDPDGSLLAETPGDNVFTGSNNFSGSTATRPDKEAAAAPATCVKGETYWNTVGLATYRCTATNTWTAEGGGSSVTIQSTSLVIKGDGAGNGIAATPGTDYLTDNDGPVVYLATFPSSTTPTTGSTDVAAANILTTPTKMADGVSFASGVLTVSRVRIADDDRIDCEFMVERDTQAGAGDTDSKIVIRLGDSVSLGTVYTNTSTTDGSYFRGTFQTYFADSSSQMNFSSLQTPGGSLVSPNSNTTPYRTTVDLSTTDWKIEVRGYITSRVDDGMIFKGGFCRLFKQTW
jgi:hypothetical protein